MRYVRRPTPYDDATIELAESLFERFVGRRLAVEEYEETVAVTRSLGRLAHTPVVEVLAVSARCETSSFVPWALESDVSPDSYDATGHFTLPSTLFGEAYTSARVRYRAGLADVPADVEACVLEIAEAIQKRTMDEWSGTGALSEEAQATIDAYKQRR